VTGQSIGYVDLNEDGRLSIQSLSPLAVLVDRKGPNESVRALIRTKPGSDRDALQVNPRSLVNVWRPRGGDFMSPWSWLMPLINSGIFRELRAMSRGLEATAYNSIIQNGILWFQSHETARVSPYGPVTGSRGPFNGPAQNPQGTPGQLPAPAYNDMVGMMQVSLDKPAEKKVHDSTLATWSAVMDKAWREPLSAAARSPFPVFWPSKPEFLETKRTYDPQRLLEVQHLETRIARGCPLPFDYVLSSGSSSAHWSRANMREETVEVMGAHAAELDASLTRAFMQAFKTALVNAGQAPASILDEEHRFHSNTQPLMPPRDNREAITLGWQSGIVLDKGYLIAHDIPEEFWAPSVTDESTREPEVPAPSRLPSETPQQPTDEEPGGNPQPEDQDPDEEEPDSPNAVVIKVPTFRSGPTPDDGMAILELEALTSASSRKAKQASPARLVRALAETQARYRSGLQESAVAHLEAEYKAIVAKTISKAPRQYHTLVSAGRAADLTPFEMLDLSVDGVRLLSASAVDVEALIGEAFAGFETSARRKLAGFRNEIVAIVAAQTGASKVAVRRAVQQAEVRAGRDPKQQDQNGAATLAAAALVSGLRDRLRAMLFPTSANTPVDPYTGVTLAETAATEAAAWAATQDAFAVAVTAEQRGSVAYAAAVRSGVLSSLVTLLKGAFKGVEDEGGSVEGFSSTRVWIHAPGLKGGVYDPHQALDGVEFDADDADLLAISDPNDGWASGPVDGYFAAGFGPFGCMCYEEPANDQVRIVTADPALVESTPDGPESLDSED
jgi:hypothetical protein